MYKKTEQITIRVNPILKDKFIVAIGFLDLSSVISAYMQMYVREFEEHLPKMKPVPVRTDKQGMYDLITTFYGIKITKERFDELLALYPKTRKNVAIY